jgi:hypothetical protein
MQLAKLTDRQRQAIRQLTDGLSSVGPFFQKMEL